LREIESGRLKRPARKVTKQILSSIFYRGREPEKPLFELDELLEPEDELLDPDDEECEPEDPEFDDPEPEDPELEDPDPDPDDERELAELPLELEDEEPEPWLDDPELPALRVLPASPPREGWFPSPGFFGGL
jgi:hypothetical protein